MCRSSRLGIRHSAPLFIRGHCSSAAGFTDDDALRLRRSQQIHTSYFLLKLGICASQMCKTTTLAIVRPCKGVELLPVCIVPCSLDYDVGMGRTAAESHELAAGGLYVLPE